MPIKLVTKAEYARHRGIRKPSVTKLIAQDKILVTPEGLIDLELSDLLLDNFSQARKRPNTPPEVSKSVDISDSATDARSDLINRLTSTGTYAEKRALLTGYKAELARLELERAKNKLVDADIVEKSAFDCARRVRDTILSLPNRLSSIIAAESSEHKVREYLTTELTKALEELSYG